MLAAAFGRSHFVRLGLYSEFVQMLGCMMCAFGVYMTNGFDKDFTCFRVWLWHGACAYQMIFQIQLIALLGA